MTIEVKIAKNGRINAKVNGKCVAINTLSELVGKSLRNNEQVELIASDGHKFTCTGYDRYEFAHPLCRRDSFNFMDDAGNTFPADTMTDAIYTVDKFASGEYKTRNIFAEYAVSAMAQEIATKAEIENAQANDVKVTEQDNSNVTIDDNGKIFDSAKVTIDQAVNIISRLNYRNDTFQYRFTTREDNADIKYRHFDAYRQNGDKDAFAISEIVINGKLEIVRFYNLFRDIIVDLHIGNLNCKLGYKGAIEIVDEPEAEFLADKIACAAETDGSEDDADDNVFDLLPDIDDLNDIESDWQYLQGIYQQIKREQGDFATKIGDATVIFRDWQVVEIYDGFTSYKKVNGKRQYRISGRLVSRKEFEEFVLIGTDDKPEPPTPPTVDELNKSPTTSLPTFEGIAYKEKLKSGCVGWHELLIGDDDNAEYLGYADGHWTRIRSIRYGAEIYAGTDNRILFIVNQYFDDKGREYPEIAKDITDAEEFFQIMAERGICAVDELKQPPAPTFEQGKAYYQRDWTAYAAATDTKPYYIIKRTAKCVFVDTNRDSCDPFRYTIRKNDKGEYFNTYDGHAVYASYNA